MYSGHFRFVASSAVAAETVYMAVDREAQLFEAKRQGACCLWL